MEITEFKDRKSRRKPSIDLSTMVYGKVPPQAKELEEAILGACMLEKVAYDIACEVLTEKSFYVDAHQRVFKAFGSLRKKNYNIDLLTVVEELKVSEELDTVGGPYAVTKLTDKVVSTANIFQHCRIVKQKFISREIIRIAGEAIGEAYEDSTDVFDLRDKFQADVNNIGAETEESEAFDMSQNMVAFHQERDRIKAIKSDLTGIPSRIRELDKCTRGWQPTDLIIIAARPSVGKSALCLNLAKNSGVLTFIFSLEMTKKQMTNRIVAAETAVKLRAINGITTPWEDKILMDKTAVLEKYPIYIEDPASLTVTQLERKVNNLIKRYIREESDRRRRLKLPHLTEEDIKNIKPLIILDYLQLMSGEDKRSTREQEISNISRNLKKIAKKNNIPVIALSQLSRGIEDRQGSKNKAAAAPRLSDLRESGAIEQDADVVAFIYCPDETKPHDIRIKIAKHRNGTLEEIDVYFDKEIQKFMNPDEVDKDKVQQAIPFDAKKKNEQFDEGIPENGFGDDNKPFSR